MQRHTGSRNSSKTVYVIIYDARPDVAVSAAQTHINSHTSGGHIVYIITLLVTKYPYDY